MARPFVPAGLDRRGDCRLSSEGIRRRSVSIAAAACSVRCVRFWWTSVLILGPSLGGMTAWFVCAALSRHQSVPLWTERCLRAVPLYTDTATFCTTSRPARPGNRLSSRASSSSLHDWRGRSVWHLVLPLPPPCFPTCDSLPVNQKAANTVLVFYFQSPFYGRAHLCASASQLSFPHVERAGSSSRRRSFTTRTRAPQPHQLCYFSGDAYSWCFQHHISESYTLRLYIASSQKSLAVVVIEIVPWDCYMQTAVRCD